MTPITVRGASAASVSTPVPASNNSSRIDPFKKECSLRGQMSSNWIQELYDLIINKCLFLLVNTNKMTDVSFVPISDSTNNDMRVRKGR